MVKKEDDEETRASFCAGLQLEVIIEGCWFVTWLRDLGFDEDDKILPVFDKECDIY